MPQTSLKRLLDHPITKKGLEEGKIHLIETTEDEKGFCAHFENRHSMEWKEMGITRYEKEIENMRLEDVNDFIWYVVCTGDGLKTQLYTLDFRYQPTDEHYQIEYRLEGNEFKEFLYVYDGENETYVWAAEYEKAYKDIRGVFKAQVIKEIEKQPAYRLKLILGELTIS
jgi:hypothetical protein